ncbi:MAG: GNAT superfamily N-acetyltransferase [Myxococcota bacterium]
MPTEVLRDAYIRYDESENPSAPPFVRLEDSALELGIVSSTVPEIARGVSSMLSCSLEDARNDRGGHLPTPVVQRVQRDIISPDGVANLWGTSGLRFVLSKPADSQTRELVATILIGSRRQTIFFLTGRYNNLRHSTIVDEVDFDQPLAGDPDQKWFDLFAFPEIAQLKPRGYHHIANFVVAKGHRGQGLSRLLLSAIRHRYARDHMATHGFPITHSQRLVCGRGFWQIGDPPWLSRMNRLGFYLRQGAESFFIEHDWAPLPPIFDGKRRISNLEYNASFDLPDRYQGTMLPDGASEHLPERISQVIELSQNPRAKLQYFQTMFDF